MLTGRAGVWLGGRRRRGRSAPGSRGSRSWSIAAMLAVLGVRHRCSPAPSATCALTRDGDRQVRLGDTATVAPHRHQQRGRRTAARRRTRRLGAVGRCRVAGTHPDRGSASAGRADRPRRPALTPTRRGDRPAVAGHASARTGRCGTRTGRARRRGRAGRHPAVDAAGAAPIRLPPVPRREGRQAADLRRLRGHPRPRPGHRIRHAARIRHRRRRALDRLARHRPPLRRRRTHLAPGTRPARRLRHRHRPHQRRTGRHHLDRPRTTYAVDEPRLDAAIDAALLLAELASRAGDPVELLAVDAAVRAAVTGGSNRTLLPRMVAALAPLQPALVETDFGLVVGEVLRRERKRALVVLFTALEPGALGEGLLPVLQPADRAAQGARRRRARPVDRDLTGARGTARRRLPGGGGAEDPRRAPPGRRRAGPARRRGRRRAGADLRVPGRRRLPGTEGRRQAVAGAAPTATAAVAPPNSSSRSADAARACARRPKTNT